MLERYIFNKAPVLNLDNVNMTQELFEYVLDILIRYPDMFEYVSLRNCRLNTTFFNQLIRAVVQSKTIKTLIVANNDIREIFELDSLGHLTYLDVSECELSSKSFSHLFNVIGNQQIHRLEYIAFGCKHSVDAGMNATIFWVLLMNRIKSKHITSLHTLTCNIQKFPEIVKQYDVYHRIIPTYDDAVTIYCPNMAQLHQTTLCAKNNNAIMRRNLKRLTSDNPLSKIPEDCVLEWLNYCG